MPMSNHQQAPPLEPTLEQVLTAISSRAGKARAALARSVDTRMAELGQLVALAADRLRASDGRAEELQAVDAMLRDAVAEMRAGYLRQPTTSEADYLAIGNQVSARYLTPAGRWRPVPRPRSR